MSELQTDRDVIATILYATGGVFEIEVTRRLAARRSAFQEILVVDTVDHGRCLVIDGVMQTASADHLIYDDAILARLRQDDRNVLIIGGGDGYVAQRVLSRAPDARLTVVDIDADVVDIAETWLNPHFRESPRIHVHIGDGVAFARGLPRASLDGVVLDLTDIPLDPNRSADVTRLFQEMIEAVLPLIRPGGWLSMQGGPSVVPPGEQDVAAIVASLLSACLDDMVREDVFLPSYGEGNSFFHGVVRAAAPPEINWRDHTEGIGLATALALSLVHRAASPDGLVEVYDHARLGRALVVNGALQDIREDAAWRELLAHVPLLGHPRPPQRVLLVGGGDGLVLTEVLRHDFVTHVTVWEANPVLPEVGARFLGTADALADARVQVVSTPDAIVGPFDVILVVRPDLRQPARAGAASLGPTLAGWLAADGVVADADAVVLHTGGARWYRAQPGAGPTVRAGLSPQGRYFATGAVVPGGFYGFALLGPSSLAPATLDLSAPRAAFTGHHYNADLHTAAFALPSFFRDLP